jgi:hypothetical protein
MEHTQATLVNKPFRNNVELGGSHSERRILT